jgi:hypothetical protein
VKTNINIELHRDSQNKITLTIRDNKSRKVFLEAQLTPELIYNILVGVGGNHCDAELLNWGIVGKTMQCQTLCFPMPDIGNKYGTSLKAIAIVAAREHIPQGWISDNDFNSKNSFYTEDGRQMARVTIRRYVEEVE